MEYVWGPKTLPPDELPQRFIAVYPGSFHVFMMNDRIMEIRHGDRSTYAFGGKLRIGATLQEALDLLGPPDATVRGKNEYKNRVLYRDIEGRKGHAYYHRADQNVRIWFSQDKVVAIYMTRSDFPTRD